MTRTNGVQHSGGRARRDALSQTVGVKEKKRQECQSTQSTPDNHMFLALVHGVAVNNTQQIPFKTTSASMNGNVMRQRDAAWMVLMS